VNRRCRSPPQSPVAVNPSDDAVRRMRYLLEMLSDQQIEKAYIIERLKVDNIIHSLNQKEMYFSLSGDNLNSGIALQRTTFFFCELRSFIS
jgi:hypothetical protein